METTVELMTETKCAEKENVTLNVLHQISDTARLREEKRDHFIRRQRKMQILEFKTEIMKEENKYLKTNLVYKKESISKIQNAPLFVETLVEVVDENTAIIHREKYNINYCVQILPTLERELLKPDTCVAMLRKHSCIVDILPKETICQKSVITAENTPKICYSDIGGLDEQKRELIEAVELPITNFELFKQIGIDPPKGVLMYGPPGCGKTMLAKAVAHHTSAAFINVNGSEFVKKYYGEGPRMVRDVFKLAKDNEPTIIFIDEVDAIATKRYDGTSGACREVQRTLIELLNQLDGFDESVNVKVIMATNRADTLDPALLRPGRIDRKIEFPIPDKIQKKLIFTTITKKMNISDDVNFDDFLTKNDKISCAEINAICMEAGMCAIRESRYVVTTEDFEKGYKAVVKKEEGIYYFYT